MDAQKAGVCLLLGNQRDHSPSRQISLTSINGHSTENQHRPVVVNILCKEIRKPTILDYSYCFFLNMSN